MERKFAFPPTRRLLKPSLYRRVFDQPSYRISRPELLLLARSNDLQFARLGMVVSKKSLPKAYQRNRVKRLIRESFRLIQHQLAGLDVIILSRREIADADNETVFRIVEGIWDKLLDERIS